MAPKKKTRKKLTKKSARPKKASAKKVSAKKPSAKKTTNRKPAKSKATIKIRNAARKTAAPQTTRSASRRSSLDRDVTVDTAAVLPKGLGARSGGQSGDLQGLSNLESANSESVDELLEEGNAFEAEIVKGVEDAGDADESEVHTHETPEGPKDYKK